MGQRRGYKQTPEHVANVVKARAANRERRNREWEEKEHERRKAEGIYKSQRRKLTTKGRPKK